jgi:RIO-like serine/threonine protein kinase
MVEALCAWGLHAPDLNATNFQVEPDGRVLALDWDKAIWIKDPDLAVRYRGRLERSLRKLGAPPEIVI